MSINFNFTKCKDYESIDHNLKEGMIWSMLLISIPNITEKNVNEVIARITFREKLFGSILQHMGDDGKIEPHYITPEEIRSCIGLTTNASSETSAVWVRRMWQNYLRDASK